MPTITLHWRNAFLLYGMLFVQAFMLIIFPGSTAERIRSVVLPYQCSPLLEDGECKWSNWTRSCFWPRPQYDREVEGFIEEIGSYGCQIPKNEFSFGVLNRRLDLLFSTMLLKRVQENKPCGGCSFRIRCCNKAPHFLLQSMDAFQCTGGTFTKACIVDGLKEEELLANVRRHPDWPHISGDMCDFNQLIPLHRAKGNDATSRLLQSLMCSFYGTSQPTITCIRYPVLVRAVGPCYANTAACHNTRDFRLSNRRCQCCCSGFVPTSDGHCVTDPTPITDPICRRDETESAGCLARKGNL